MEVLSTPGLILGPFYPVQRSLDAHASTASILSPAAGRCARTLIVRGRVCDSDDHPLTGARVEIWQADPAGRYRHPGDPQSAQVDPHLHFQVTCEGHRLVTQMFFPGHPLNRLDRWYRTASRPALLVARASPDPSGCQALEFDIVMRGAATASDTTAPFDGANHE
jgi:protocatechuate 3,4-dioxygenase beta subunit